MVRTRTCENQFFQGTWQALAFLFASSEWYWCALPRRNSHSAFIKLTNVQCTETWVSPQPRTDAATSMISCSRSQHQNNRLAQETRQTDSMAGGSGRSAAAGPLSRGETHVSVYWTFVNFNEGSMWRGKAHQYHSEEAKRNASACHVPWKNWFSYVRVRTVKSSGPKCPTFPLELLVPTTWKYEIPVSLYTIKLELPAAGHDNGTPATGYKFCTWQFTFKLI